MRTKAPVKQRLFIATMAAGLSYCDTSREKDGDYLRLAFLPYGELRLQWDKADPGDLKRAIEEHAASVRAQAGTQYRVSTTGQTVLLGDWLLKHLKDETCKEFQVGINVISARAKKTNAYVYMLWRDYEKSCTDQSAILHEFERWYREEMMADCRLA